MRCIAIFTASLVGFFFGPLIFALAQVPKESRAAPTGSASQVTRHPDAPLRAGEPSPGGRSDGLGFHAPGSPQLPARDELLRPARERAGLLPTGPSPPDGPEPATLQPERPDAGWLRPRAGTERGSTGRAGTAGSAPCLTGLPSRTYHARASPSNASISPCTRTGPARWRATTTAATRPTRLFPSRIAGRSSRPRGRSPSTCRLGAGPTRSSTDS